MTSRTSRALRAMLPGAVLIVLAVAGGCTQPPKGTIDVHDIQTTTTAPRPTTTAAPTTTSPPTTTTLEVITTTSDDADATTTTTLDQERLEAQVAADFLDARDERTRCGREPETCDFDRLALPGSAQDLYNRSIMADRIASNQRTVEGNGELQTLIESIAVSGTTATIVACQVDSLVLFDAGDLSDPSDDVILDDGTSSTRIHWDLVLDSGRWRLTGGLDLEQIEGASLCATQPD